MCTASLLCCHFSYQVKKKLVPTCDSVYIFSLHGFRWPHASQTSGRHLEEMSGPRSPVSLAASTTPPTNLLQLGALWQTSSCFTALGHSGLPPLLTSASVLLREMLTSICLEPSPQSDFLPFLCQQKSGLLLPVLASSVLSHSAT